ncbi:MAG: hypothetical protein LBU22_05470 [Dysgonamonadaceae bacterium]|jgi:hypothetical protein|nr:hypothetical protein [Dysgonamonadaceae bacterium]
MKKSGKKFNQVVSGVLSATVLTGSCLQYSCTESDLLYGNIATNNSDLGELAIPISLKLKPQDVQYIKALQKITYDILNSPKKAKDFNDNPKLFLQKYGYEGNIQLDDNLLKITMALADNEINDAIKKKDIKLFIKLCKEKGIITQSKGIFADNFYQDQFDEILNTDSFKKFQKQFSLKKEFDEIAVFLPFAIVMAVAAAVVVGIWAIAVWQEAVWIDSGAMAVTDATKTQLDVIDIYALKNEGEIKETYIAVDKYTEELVDKSISVLKEIQPDFFDNNLESEVRNIIKINILNNLCIIN